MIKAETCEPTKDIHLYKTGIWRVWLKQQHCHLVVWMNHVHFKINVILCFHTSVLAEVVKSTINIVHLEQFLINASFLATEFPYFMPDFGSFFYSHRIKEMQLKRLDL